MRLNRFVMLATVVGMLALAPALTISAWDFEMNKDFPVTDIIPSLVINPCANPPQVLEDWSGTHHIMQQINFVKDENGNYLGFEGKVHTNHQSVKAVGYDLVVDADGKVVVENGKPKKAVDANGNFITTEYSIPGTFNYEQHVNQPAVDGKWENNETFMCMMISHGSQGNALIHYNGHLTVHVDGTMEMLMENFWCKCAGAGPDQNGKVDCSTFGSFCVAPVLPGGPY